MPILTSTVAAFAVAAVYCAWCVALRARQVHLRRRVAYMLWVMAREDEGADLPAEARPGGTSLTKDMIALDTVEVMLALSENGPRR